MIVDVDKNTFTAKLQYRSNQNVQVQFDDDTDAELLETLKQQLKKVTGLEVEILDLDPDFPDKMNFMIRIGQPS